MVFFKSSIGFQSTRPRGARLLILGGMKQNIEVSIHAPARGATLQFFPVKGLLMFQSTRPRGARPPRLPSAGLMTGFQSTRPRGARRRSECRIYSRANGFNPRAREGRDLCHKINRRIHREFQSTRPRGARLFLYKSFNTNCLKAFFCEPRISASQFLQVVKEQY